MKMIEFLVKLILFIKSVGGPFLVKVGWATSCGIGPECSGYRSWDRSNYNSTWSGLCTN